MKEIGLHKGKEFDIGGCYWSSLEHSSDSAYYLFIYDGYTDYNELKDDSDGIRPVLNLN